MADEIPSSKGVVATVGKKPLPIVVDFNKDGINDLEQVGDLIGHGEWFLRFLLSILPANWPPTRWIGAYFSHFRPKVEEVLRNVK